MSNIVVDDDVLYNKIIIKNISDYSIQILNNELIICRIIPEIVPEIVPDISPSITYDELIKKDLRKSKIIYCKINNELIPNMIKYKKIINYIFSKLSKDIILSNTKINISDKIINEKGYIYDSNIGLSIQGTDAKKALIEIIHQLSTTNQTLEIQIKLKSNDIILFRL